MNIVMDAMDGASVEVAYENAKATRTGVVTDIPAQVRSDPYVLARAILESGGPQLGEPHPSLVNIHLIRIVAKPTGGTDQAEVSYQYEGIGSAGGTGQAILVVEDDTTLATEMEEIDLNGFPIQAIYRFTPEKVDNEPSHPSIDTPKTASIPVLRPRRTLNVSGILLGRKLPQSWARQAVGQVNAEQWPSGSLWDGDKPDKPGFWLCTHVSASVDRYKYQTFDNKFLPYKIRLSFQSKVFRSWTSYAIYRNHAGNVPNDLARQAAAWKAIVEGDYSIDQLNVQNGGANGLVAVGMYRTAHFKAIFGF